MVQIYLISSNTTVSIMFCKLFNMLKVIYSIEILPLPVQKQTVHVLTIIVLCLHYSVFMKFKS